MPTRTPDAYLLEDLETGERLTDLADRDREALHAVADWLRSFVVRPHDQLGRPGTVCPFVPVSVERHRLRLVPEEIGDGGVPAVAGLMEGYRRRLVEAAAAPGGDTTYDVFVVVFPDLPADRAAAVFDDVLDQIAAPAYVEDGVVFGPFYDGHPGTAIYNDAFHPFKSPVPFLFVRHGVVGDWKFFLGKEDWLTRWARRFGESATLALADELRRLPWNARRP